VRRLYALYAAIAGLFGYVGWIMYQNWNQGTDGDPSDGVADDDSSGGNSVTGNACASTLQGNAASACSELLRAYPQTVLTCGARDVASQCHAVAVNTVQAGGGSSWVSRTYLPSAVKTAICQWLDSNPSTDVDTIAAGLTSVCGGFSNDDLSAFSKHLGGQAFDVQPGSVDVSVLQSLHDQHVANGGQCTFLTREGGLTRWHIQFDDSVSTTFALSADNSNTSNDV
jgi:hypothetical protein